ncbi:MULTISPECIES: hypothetical protein [Halorubrum]|uniref:AP2 domain-containing protein n=1 Tax=Halorubrum laminariae TaxID=1433523 RepID=A0ABD6C199_9EURY|nr:MULTISPECIES: hypothetical protein [Halorubrum]CDK38187.1 hypothetical protein BN903_387 [Halorubrum sp. AJ67]
MPRTKYRKEITADPAHPSGNDHYAIGISPPTASDTTYCRVRVEGKSWGRSGRKFETRSEAIGYIRQTLDDLEEKSLDDKYRGSINYYPEPPKPSNTRYVVHPDYEGEIGPREIWGDATLGSFGVASQSRLEEKPWYQVRDAYADWGKPLREGDTVLQLFGERHTQYAFWWFTVSDGSVQMIEYQFGRPSVTVSESSWTTVTRCAGGIGLTRAKPLDRRHLPADRTPFRVGHSDEAIVEWLQQHPPEPPETVRPD